jgi:hypothetical protein
MDATPLRAVSVVAGRNAEPRCQQAIATGVAGPSPTGEIAPTPSRLEEEGRAVGPLPEQGALMRFPIVVISVGLALMREPARDD